jgi:dihydroflavonol-4-reductase
VLTSTISAVGLPSDGQPATERTEYPADWLGLTYPDSKHEGERAALEAGARHDVEVVVVNPAYLFGVPVDRAQPAHTSTRTIGNYLRGRLPAVIDAHMNFADVEDVAAGHLLAAEHGRPGERYILGAENLTWPALIDRVAELSGVHYPVVVMPPQIRRVARVRAALGLPGVVSVQGYELMAKDWRFSSTKAERELDYRTRPLDETLEATIRCYLELIDQGVFGDADRSAMSSLAGGMRRAGALGLLSPVRVGQRIVGRRVLAGV